MVPMVTSSFDELHCVLHFQANCLVTNLALLAGIVAFTYGSNSGLGMTRSHASQPVSQKKKKDFTCFSQPTCLLAYAT